MAAKVVGLAASDEVSDPNHQPGSAEDLRGKGLQESFALAGESIFSGETSGWRKPSEVPDARERGSEGSENCSKRRTHVLQTSKTPIGPHFGMEKRI